MVDAPRFVGSGDPVIACGHALAGAIVATDAEFGRARVAIPGGSALASLVHARNDLADTWRRVHLTWVDERCVPLAEVESNRGRAYRSGALTDAHRPALELPLYEDGETGAGAVRRVDEALRAHFDGALDVLLLGLGEDGHVASIFPGASFADDALAAFVTDSPKAPRERITLSPRVLESARACFILAIGESKRHALERLRERDPALPATHLPNVSVVTDLDLGTGAVR